MDHYGQVRLVHLVKLGELSSSNSCHLFLQRSESPGEFLCRTGNLVGGMQPHSNWVDDSISALNQDFYSGFPDTDE